MKNLSRFLLLIALVELIACQRETPLANNGNESEKIYNSVELDQLRAFLRQPSALYTTRIEANLKCVGLSPSDTAKWTTDETWVSKISNIYWNTDTPKRLTHINWDNKQVKGNLNLSNFSALTKLYCRETFITSLNVSGCTSLQDLHCWSYELLKFPNVSSNTSLHELSFHSDQMYQSYDVSKNTELKYLDLKSTGLKSIDVSKNTALTKLELSYNGLTSLDVSKCTVLEYVSLAENNLSSTALNNLFTTLNSNTISSGKKIYVYTNPGFSTCNTTIATSKGWTVL
ncbi:MAG: hypothetical protein E6Q24_10760 [Chitinophagaceae bacterium]|nr:MAG: hypothetical protein E6Q24_10760 [Chitinophagaceae bacterium]